MDAADFPSKLYGYTWHGGHYWFIIIVFYRLFRWMQGMEILGLNFILSSIVFVAAWILKSVLPQTLQRNEQIDVLTFMLAAIMAPQMLCGGNSDMIFKHRGLGMYAILWRTFLPTYCLNHLGIGIFAGVVLLFSEIMVTKQSFNEDGLEMPTRVPFVLFAASTCFIVFGKHLQSHWKNVRNIQWELSEEKKAQETLISMLCSSCAHVGCDGDTLIRSSGQFDLMMGQDVQGKKLTSFMPSDRNERDRVQDAFSRARISPVTLPVTLFSLRGIHNLDVFIVRRYTVASSSGLVDSGFLVGFRFSQDNVEDLCGVPPHPLHMGTSEMTTDASDAKDADHESLQEFSRGAPSEFGQTPSVITDREMDITPEQHLHSTDQIPAEPYRKSFLSPPGKLPISRPISDPNTAVVWSEDSALPKPISAASKGERILCYDNVAQGLTYAKVVSVGTGHETSDVVTVGFEDGTSLRLKANHPVAIQEIEDAGGSLQPRRICLHASELRPARHSLLVTRILPTLVTSIESNASESTPVAEHQVLTIAVEQPERFEPLMANSDRNGTTGQPIAISSYDRVVDGGLNVHMKNTFICLQAEKATSENRSVRSAPPRYRIGECRTSSMNGDALNQHMESTESGPAASWPDLGSFASGGDVSLDLDSCAMSDSGTLMSSAASIGSEGNSNVKIGCEGDARGDFTRGVRLTDLMSLKSSGHATMGSIVSSHDSCIPCSFHFTHLRLPDRRPPCKASYLCEYCHDATHNDEWRSKFRKSRPPISNFKAGAGSRSSNLRARTTANNKPGGFQ